MGPDGPAVELHCGDCLETLGAIADASVDAVVTDPPYPEIDRPYGRMTEAEWHQMMRGVVAECRRILKPTGSAVFVLQPNSERVGRMRPWLWEFMAWTAREWNQVQDVWWWNTSALPLGGCNRYGLLRPSLKACVWLGLDDCHKDQAAVLASESDQSRFIRDTESFGESNRPSRARANVPKDDQRRMYAACAKRGGVTPFNVLPFGSGGRRPGGPHDHGASTPYALCDWWVRYITPPGGVVCDPFLGSGTVALAALAQGRSFVGGERDPGYFETARRRIDAARAAMPLFA
jgi:DNA modification methylase